MKKDNWFEKHPVWSGVIILLGFFFIIGIFSGDIKETGEGIKPISLENNISSEPTENETFKIQNIEKQKDYFLVTRVIDGDTIEIEGGERVGFICINTPETGEYIFLEDKNFVTDILLYKEVKLVKDVTDRDKYGRLLRYIYLEDGTFVNEQIVRVGYGVAYPYGQDTSLCPLIENAEREAREDKIGIWAIEEEEEIPVFEEEYVCSTNVYNCGDFSSCSEVMEVFNGCGFDVHKLDGDNDGIPCDSLCG